MFIPQRYMTLSVGLDKIHLNKVLFGMVEDSYETLSMNYNLGDLIRFFEKYKGTIGILIDNDKKCIELFQEMIDDGEPVPGYVMLFDSHIFFLLTSRAIPQGIKRLGDESSIQQPESVDNVIKLPDIRKLLDRV